MGSARKLAWVTGAGHSYATADPGVSKESVEPESVRTRALGVAQREEHNVQAFVWNENFVTGFDGVDDQHRYLVELINRFGRLIEFHGVKYEDVESLYGQLMDYCRYHFEEEERLMTQAGIDRGYKLKHMLWHQSFLLDVQVLYEEISPDDLHGAQDLLDFLSNWLACHILGEDQVMARQVSAINAGASPDEALAKAMEDNDRPVQPLLKAMKGLLTQLATRNESLVALNRSLEKSLAERTQQVSELDQRLRTLSVTDGLTGLPNRRYAREKLTELWARAENTKTHLICILVDVDGLRKVNEKSGYGTGDRVLVELGRALMHSVRSDDIVCRTGGDEFLVLCPGTDIDGGLKVANFIRQEILDLCVTAGEDGWLGSVSLGMASRHAGIRNSAELIEAADQAVSYAKRDGKNCIHLASETGAIERMRQYG